MSSNRGAIRLLSVTAVTLGAALAVLVVSSTRAQQQSKDQQNCILAVNKATRGVAKAEAKNIGACLKAGSKDLDPALVDDCIASDLKQKVAGARQKTVDAIASRCTVPPDFGFTDADTANDSAVIQEVALLADVFGDDIGAAVTAGNAQAGGARCQQLMQKSYEKVLQAQIRTFEACKKSGMKGGTIDSQAALAACLDAIPADPKGKIGKAVLKLNDTIAKACPGVNMGTAFPGGCTSPGFADCIEAKSLCRACLLLDEADNTGVYCDVFDNGTADASCVDVRRCGNGTVEPGEECDDDNNTSGDCCSATCTSEPDGQSCNDGSFCNGTDTCAASACTVHAGNPCPGPDGDADCSETCDESADACTGNDTDGSPCPDGLFCTGTDTCTAGTCMHTGNPCPGPDGDNDCAESCNEGADNCFAADPNGSACDDAAFCTGTETCSAGACSVHTGDPCDGPDGDADCSETCDESADDCNGNDTDGSACTDSAFCTGTETCSAGACSVHSGDPCDGPDGDGDCSETCDESADDCDGADTDGVVCDDGTFCNGIDSCLAGQCDTHPGDPCPGADGDGDCSETCDEAADSCAGADSDGVPCDDGIFCNGLDTCSGGTCSVHTGDPCSGADGDANCSETCDESADTCGAPDPDGSACTDGLFCTGADTCVAGACTGHAGDPCPGPDGDGNCAESCDEGADDCDADDSDGSACDDGTFCNGADSCLSGACTVHPGDPCPGADGDANCSETCDETADNCAGADANGSACDDGLFCTGVDFCNNGTCAFHTGNACPGPDGDGNCAESCNEAADDCSANDTNGSACADGLFCNGTDACFGGACSAHTGDPCSGPDGDGNCAESCDEATDNCAANDPNGSACNDGLFCNGADTCAGGACSGHAGDPCPGADGDGNCAESCNEASDNCTLADPNGSTCTDGLFCNGADTCSGGACSGHAGNPCPGADGDGNCSESCNEAADNCLLADPNGSACNDGLFCNGTDTCSGGACSGHAGNPCPGADGDGNCSESCNETSDNCTLADPNGSACSDGLFCNGTDTCSGGACTGHTGDPCLPLNTGDANCSTSCNETSDNCSAADPNGTGCNDGQGCNGADSCSGGSCVGSGVCCGTVDFTFTVNSNNGGAFDSAEWPGGTASQNAPTSGCSVTINRPNNNIDLVCGTAAPFSINSFAGFQSCAGINGEDGDGCQPVSCPPAGIGQCCQTRPSCSAALNGSGSARYFVRCTDP